MFQQPICTCILLKLSAYAKVTSPVLLKCLWWYVNTFGVKIPHPFPPAFDEAEEAISDFLKGKQSKARMA